MLTSLALIFLLGLAMASICHKIKLPRIIGMLITGIILGPQVLNLIDKSIISISPELRKMALVIILIKAGLSLNLNELKKVGRPAFFLSFIPASFEISGFVLLAPAILGITKIESAIMGSVISAVSLAIVIPKMVQYLESKNGTKTDIMQMLIASSSLDNVFSVVLFSAFINAASENASSITSFLKIPLSILLGLGVGGLCGNLVAVFFERCYAKGEHVRNSVKVIVILSAAFLMIAFENWLSRITAFSGLLAVISMACVVQIKSHHFVSKRLSDKFGKLWLAAELILFVLVGAVVNIKYFFHSGSAALLMIAAALLFRSLGVLLSLAGTKFTHQERLFCLASYVPKATVQAAIGSVPLSMGLPCGEAVLTVAVISIITTAPLGALAIDLSYKGLTKRNVTPSLK